MNGTVTANNGSEVDNFSGCQFNGTANNLDPLDGQTGCGDIFLSTIATNRLAGIDIEL